MSNDAPAQDAEAGARHYYDYGCYACHGYNGTGRMPLSKATSGTLSSEALFIRYLRLRADQNPVNPKNTVPNYAEATLSDNVASEIYAYLLSLEDDPPAVEDIPAFMELLEYAERGSQSETQNDP
ncbi:MAG: c-type cytochrome [Pseudomonadota bacterium]